MKPPISLLLCVAVSVTLPAPAGASHQATVALVGGMLLDGYEAPPIHDAVVVVSDGVIVAVGSESETEIPAGAQIIDTGGRTILPGLIDAHTHLDILGHGNYDDWYAFVERTDRLDEVMEIAAKQLLRAGVTSALDLGAPLSILRVRQRIARREIPGPRLQVSGPWVTRVTMEGIPLEMQNVVGSPEEAAAATARLIDAGVDVIKTWVGLTADDMHAIVDTARARRVPVHSHLYTPEAIRIALDVGVDVLQHVGSGGNPPYDDTLVAEIAHRGVPIVQTIAHRIWIYPATLEFPSRLRDPRLAADLPADIWEEMQRSFVDFRRLPYFRTTPRQIRNSKIAARQFIEADAVIAVGTDSASPLNFHTEAMWREISALIDSGMTPLQAISSATKTGAEVLRIADITGTIEPGKRADIIVVDGNPLFDINMLGHVDLVMKDGVVWFSSLEGVQAREP